MLKSISLTQQNFYENYIDNSCIRQGSCIYKIKIKKERRSVIKSQCNIGFYAELIESIKRELTRKDKQREI